MALDRGCRPGCTTTYLAGEPVPVVQGVRRDTVNSGIAQYDFSDNGTLIYLPGGAGGTGDARLAIVDRNASAHALPLASGTYSDPRVSPDGSVAAFTASYPDGEDVTAYRLAGDSAPLRLTFGGTSRFPVWSADGLRVAFQSTRDGAPSIYWQLADGSAGAPERLTTPAGDEIHIPESFSPEGRSLLFTVQKDNETAIWILDLETHESKPLISALGVDYTQPVFSPNGKWIAYMSTETGSNEIFVQPYPPTGAKRQLPHTIDNHHPVWSADGSELIYTPGPNRFESVRVTTEPVFSFGPAQALGNIPMNQAPERRRQYDIMPDGSGFLGFVTGTDDQGVERNQIDIVYNWFDELERLVPTK